MAPNKIILLPPSQLWKTARSSRAHMPSNAFQVIYDTFSTLIRIVIPELALTRTHSRKIVCRTLLSRGGNFRNWFRWTGVNWLNPTTTSVSQLALAAAVWLSWRQVVQTEPLQSERFNMTACIALALMIGPALLILITSLFLLLPLGLPLIFKGQQLQELFLFYTIRKDLNLCSSGVWETLVAC